MSKYGLGIISTISVIVILLLSSVELFTFNLNFYDREFKKYGISESIQVSHYDLLNVTGRLLGYMKGDYPDLVIETIIEGERREFFNQREKDHMIDVRNLFEIGYTIRRIAVIILIITILAGFLYKNRDWRPYARCLQVGIIGFLALAGGTAALIFSDFNKYFNIFHEIFFDNDLWLLNPQTDLLVNIVPLPFFIDIFTAIVTVFVVLLVFLALCATIYIRYMNSAKMETD